MNRQYFKWSVFIYLPLLLSAEPARQQTVTAANELITVFQGDAPDNFIAPALLEISINGQNLPAETKQQLAAYGFDFSRAVVTRSRPIMDHSFDIGNYRIHYDTSGTDAVSTADIAGLPGIPDYVEMVANAFIESDNVLFNQLGYTRPPSDGSAGGSGNYDIYLASLPPSYYAFTYSENPVGDNENSSVTEHNAYTSYIELRNNYNGFPNTEEENIQVTAAHEFFHAVQFGYDAMDARSSTPNEIWMLEATAVLMEEVIFDNVNDCYQYMPGWFSRPYRSLDQAGSHAYGSFIFFQYISEHLGGLPVIRKIFDESVNYNSAYGDYSQQEINAALSSAGSSFKEALNGMVIANLIMSDNPNADPYTYEEAGSYPVDIPAIDQTIDYFAGDTLTIHSISLHKYASQYYGINTLTPVLVSLTNTSGPAGDLSLIAILENADGSYDISTGNPININSDYNSIYLAVVSQDTVGNDYNFELFIEEGDTGNYVIPDDFVLEIIYPNPYNSNSGEPIYFVILNRHAQVFLVEVFDLYGRKAATLYNGLIGRNKKASLRWNGKDNSGMPAASGVYFVLVSGQTNQAGRSFTVVK